MGSFEQTVLGRAGENITALTGYAGGVVNASSQRACYDNAGKVDEYVELGHAEAVSIEADDSGQVKQTVEAFLKTFKEIETGVYARPDVFDQGAQYRAIIGIPGGLTGPLGAAVHDANHAVHGVSLVEGKGSDPDTFQKNSVFIYDTDKGFRFFQAEPCLQFHDDQNEKYPAAYHNLKNMQQANHRIVDTGCPTNFIC